MLLKLLERPHLVETPSTHSHVSEPKLQRPRCWTTLPPAPSTSRSVIAMSLSSQFYPCKNRFPSLSQHAPDPRPTLRRCLPSLLARHPHPSCCPSCPSPLTPPRPSTTPPPSPRCSCCYGCVRCGGRLTCPLILLLTLVTGSCVHLLMAEPAPGWPCQPRRGDPGRRLREDGRRAAAVHPTECECMPRPPCLSRALLILCSPRPNGRPAPTAYPRRSTRASACSTLSGVRTQCTFCHVALSLTPAPGSLAHLCVYAYWRTLHSVPFLARLWWDDAPPKLAQRVGVFTGRVVSPLLIALQFEAITVCTQFC